MPIHALQEALPRSRIRGSDRRFLPCSHLRLLGALRGSSEAISAARAATILNSPSEAAGVTPARNIGFALIRLVGQRVRKN